MEQKHHRFAGTKKQIEAHPAVIEFAKELQKHKLMGKGTGFHRYQVPAYIVDAYANAKPKQ